MRTSLWTETKIYIIFAIPALNDTMQIITNNYLLDKWSLSIVSTKNHLRDDLKTLNATDGYKDIWEINKFS